MNVRSWGRLSLLAIVMISGMAQAEVDDGLADALPATTHCEPTSPAVEVPLGTCQADAVEEIDVAGQERKEYIKRVLLKSRGKSSGIDLKGRRLERTGSGFFVATDGRLVTSYRLVEGCALISVSPTFGEMAAAMPIGTDGEADLAVLRTDVVPPGIARFTATTGALHGEPTYVIGYPGLGTTTDEPTLTSVRILGSQKTVFSLSTIVIEGAVRSGNNGGPLLDSSGGVIGIVLANRTQTYAATGGEVDSVGLVLPDETLRHFLQANSVDDRAGLKLPPKSRDRLLIDARPFMAQVGCWQ